MDEDEDVTEESGEDEEESEETGEESATPPPKFSDTEIIFLILFGLLCDVADWLFADIPVANVLAFPVVYGVLWKKGVKADYMMIINVLKFAPGIDLAPTRTIGLAFVAYEDRHPKLAAVASKLAKVKQGPAAPGAVPGLEETGAAAAIGREAGGARQPYLAPAGEKPRMINAAGTPPPPEFNPEDYNLPAAPMTEVQENLFERPTAPPRPSAQNEADILNKEEAPAGRAAEERKNMELEERMDTGTARLERLKRGEYEEPNANEGEEFKEAA